GPQAVAQDQDVCRYQRERGADPDLDGADRHAPAEVSPAAQHLRLELLPFGGPDTTSAIRLPRPDELAEQPLPGSARAGGHPRPAVPAGLCPAGRKLIWIARFRFRAYLLSLGHHYGENLDSTPQH